MRYTRAIMTVLSFFAMAAIVMTDEQASSSRVLKLKGKNKSPYKKNTSTSHAYHRAKSPKKTKKSPDHHHAKPSKKKTKKSSGHHPTKAQGKTLSSSGPNDPGATTAQSSKPVFPGMGVGCFVENKTDKNIIVLTFNEIDTVYQYFSGMFAIEPGQTSRVGTEIGLPAYVKVAVVYGVVADNMLFRVWSVGRDATLRVLRMSGSDVQATGGKHITQDKIRVDRDTMQFFKDWSPLALQLANRKSSSNVLFPGMGIGCFVENKTDKNIIVLTFNEIDTAYQYFSGMFAIEPGQISRVGTEIGLPAYVKVAVVYQTVTDNMLFRVWSVEKDGTFTVLRMSGSDVQATGGKDITQDKIRVDRDTLKFFRNWAPLALQFSKQKLSSKALFPGMGVGCFVENKTDKNIIVLTFNEIDTVYQYFSGMFAIEPGQTSRVGTEIGLPAYVKVAVVYGVVADNMLFRVWSVGRDATLKVLRMNSSDIKAAGGKEITQDEIRVDRDTMQFFKDWSPLALQFTKKKSRNKSRSGNS